MLHFWRAWIWQICKDNYWLLDVIKYSHVMPCITMPCQHRHLMSPSSLWTNHLEDHLQPHLPTIESSTGFITTLINGCVFWSQQKLWEKNPKLDTDLFGYGQSKHSKTKHPNTGKRSSTHGRIDHSVGRFTPSDSQGSSKAIIGPISHQRTP